jgi:hypothetical protein
MVRTHGMPTLPLNANTTKSPSGMVTDRIHFSTRALYEMFVPLPRAVLDSYVSADQTAESDIDRTLVLKTVARNDGMFQRSEKTGDDINGEVTTANAAISIEGRMLNCKK